MVRPSLRSLLLALTLAVVSYVVTHILPIPGGLRQVMTATGGALLDQIPSISGEDVYARVAAFGAQGREPYRNFTLTTDIVFPLTWMPFLLLYARFAYSRFAAGPPVRSLMLAFPVVYLVADVVENAFVWVMLTDFPTRHSFLARAIVYPTVAKWLAPILAVLVPTMMTAWGARYLLAATRRT